MKNKRDSEQRLSYIYNVIETFINEKGFPPTVRELMEILSIASTSTIIYYLNKLEEKNLIKRDSNKSRSIELTKNLIANSKQNIKKVPLLGDVAAGTPIFASINYDDVYEISDNLFNIASNDVFMLTIKGDSMINAGILNNDKVLVRKQETAENTEIIVAMIDDSVTVKRFYKEKDRIRLQPENDSMEPIYAKNVKILGKVIGLIRHIK